MTKAKVQGVAERTGGLLADKVSLKETSREHSEEKALSKEHKLSTALSLFAEGIFKFPGLSHQPAPDTGKLGAISPLQKHVCDNSHGL